MSYLRNEVYTGWVPYGSSIIYPQGNVGIGTNNPAYALDIVDQTNSIMRFTEYNSTDGPVFRVYRALGTIGAPSGVIADSILGALRAFGYNSSGAFSGRCVSIEMAAAETFTSTATGTYMAFQTCTPGTTTNSEKMRILGNGNVGIGIATPGALLDIQAAPGSAGVSTYATSNIVANFGGTGGTGECVSRIYYTDSGITESGVRIGVKTVSLPGNISYPFQTYYNGTASMSVTSGGKVGIGATNPVSPLQIQCGDNYVQGISFSSAAVNAVGASDFMIQRGPSVNMTGGVAWNTSNVMTFHTPNESVATAGPVGYLWMSSGSRIGMFYDVKNSRLGIGITAPTSPLHLYGNMRIDMNVATYNTQSATQAWTAGTWYTLVSPNVLTRLDNGTQVTTYLVTLRWVTTANNPYNLYCSFLFCCGHVNDTSANQLTGAPVVTAYHATNTAGDFQVSIRGNASGFTNDGTGSGFDFKVNATTTTGYWIVKCMIISYW